MKKSSLLLVASLLAVVAACAQTRTFVWQGSQRQFLMYEPVQRTGAVPVMYFLHGLGDNITRCEAEMGFAELADAYGWVILVPQALSVQNTTMWNVGFGGTADDAGFLLALLDSLQDAGRVNPDSVFFTGFSLGGFMTHKMAIEHGDRITACAPVSGLITFALADEVPVAPVRMMHIHGTADDVVGWNGGSAYFGSIGISVDSLVRYWTEWNGCTSDADIDSLPNRVGDGLRFVRHSYGGGEADFRLIEVIGGSHNWYTDSTIHDIDYFDVIHRFFLGDGSTLGLSWPDGGEADALRVWPNPASRQVHVLARQADTVTLADLRGVGLMRSAVSDSVATFDVCALPAGTYLLSDNCGATQRLVVAR